MLPESFGGRIIYLLQQYGPSFAKGAGVSMWLALVGTLFGCIIGFLVGIVQTIPVDKNDSTAKKILIKIVKFILACYVEFFRGGILSIDPGQTEGAKAIGMTHVQTMINVILPQALRNIMPQIGNNLIINIKDTCVLSIIGTVELFYTTKGVAGALYTYFESFTIAMIIYFIMTFTCSRILRVLEHKMDGPDNYDLATADTLTHTSGMYSYRERKDDRE